jgi:hypothetical protein
MSDTIDWIAVEKFKLIGAVGFIGEDAVAIAAFYEDTDANKDGKVSWDEWVGSKLLFDLRGTKVTEVAMQARFQMNIIERDPSFNQIAMSMFLCLASGLIAQGVYKAYFSQPVSLIGSSLASIITSNMIKQFVIRKGFEAAVKRTFMKGVDY